MTLDAASLHWLAERYLDAKEFVLARGYAPEIDWQEERDPDRVSDRDFMAQAAWVVLSAGLSARTVQGRFGALTVAFLEWDPFEIDNHHERCVADARELFRHEGKLRAIVNFARILADGQRRDLTELIRRDGPDSLEYLPYMGPATSRHLAKAIGFDIAKPDRHLVRLASRVGATSADELCQGLGSYLTERTSVVDLVLWRYATLRPDYLDFFDRHAFRRVSCWTGGTSRPRSAPMGELATRWRSRQTAGPQ
jgi:hypothetical protein